MTESERKLLLVVAKGADRRTTDGATIDALVRTVEAEARAAATATMAETLPGAGAAGSG